MNRKQIRGASLVANPGCYVTAVTLALLPLLSAGVIDETTIIADAKSGVSGAGRGASVGSLYAEVSENFKAYKASGHRHLPEIRQNLTQIAGHSVDLTFVPHLLPQIRGIHATLYAKILRPTDLQKLYTDYYEDESFVQILPAGSHPETRTARGTNLCQIAPHQPQSGETVVVLSVIDNLIKGAAGQAVQNMNLMFGLAEETAILALFSVIIAGVLGYLFAESKHQQANAPDVNHRIAMESELVELRSQNSELTSKLAFATTSGAIDDTASRVTQQSLADKEQELKTAREELSFYKSILAPQGAETGLNIYSFIMEDTENLNENRYRLVLTQVGGGSLEARGTVLLRVQGYLYGDEKVLEWWDIRPESTMPMPSFGFKYFQRMDGLIIFPEGFVADNILVKIIPDSTRLKSSQQSYTWDAVYTGA